MKQATRPFSSFASYVATFFEISSLRKRHKQLDTRYDTVYTYRGSSRKPPVVTNRPFELFHRNRRAFFAVQAVFLVLVGVWTVLNYIHVFKTF